MPHLRNDAQGRVREAVPRELAHPQRPQASAKCQDSAAWSSLGCAGSGRPSRARRQSLAYCLCVPTDAGFHGLWSGGREGAAGIHGLYIPGETSHTPQGCPISAHTRARPHTHISKEARSIDYSYTLHSTCMYYCVCVYVRSSSPCASV